MASTIIICSGVVVSYALYKLFTVIFRPTLLHTLPGPDGGHWFFGYSIQIWNGEPAVLHEGFVKEHGHVLSLPELFRSRRMVTTDTRALGHILQRSDIYQKPYPMRFALEKILGAGLIVAEGDAHRRQRKVLNPAFGPSQLRALTDVMLDKANELRDILETLVSLSSSGSTEIDALIYTSRCTLDIIGIAGFGYDFSSLSSPSGEQSELFEAFNTSFSFASSSPLWSAITFVVPWTRYLPTEQNKKSAKAMATMERIGRELLHERKIQAQMDDAQGEKLSETRARDLLSLLVKANVNSSPSERMSDTEVLAQIPTFLAAGHETTSTFLGWTLFELAAHPELQAKLRAECLANPIPAMAEGNHPLTSEQLMTLDKLPLLDAVVREGFRLHAPSPGTVRQAVADDAIPLGKPYVARDGSIQESIPIKKGDAVLVPILLVNRSKELWGDDAHTFRPERWIDGVPESVKSMPGPWSNMLTFIGGPHACIGYRFSLYESKIILHSLMCALQFDLGVPYDQIVARNGMIARPVLKGKVEEGPRMPVIVKRASQEI